MTNRPLNRFSGLLVLVVLMASHIGAALAEDDLVLKRAKWIGTKEKLRVVGTAESPGATVTIENADTGQLIGTAVVDSGQRWVLVVKNPDRVPCAVGASIDEDFRVSDVANAPSDCDDGGVVDNGDLQGPGESYTLLAANDLGMHCADLDYQVFSILPPFNVVHAQVIASTSPRCAVTNPGRTE